MKLASIVNGTEYPSGDTDSRPSTARLRPRGAGGGAEALSYSLIESAKLAEVEPGACMGEAARRAIRSPRTVTLAADRK